MKKITSICLTIFLGVNIVSAYAARGEQLAILSEDFSAFTEGTESTPAESELSTGNAMIPMEFTHGIQWKGRGIHQAGGVCAVLSYDDYTYGETQGWIQTPYTDVRLDDGNFILRFRARSIAQTKDSLILYLQDQYSSNYYTSEKRTITDQWQTIEVSFQHNFGMGSRLAYVQIGAYNDSWLIDDIEIIQGEKKYRLGEIADIEITSAPKEINRVNQSRTGIVTQRCDIRAFYRSMGCRVVGNLLSYVCLLLCR